MGGWRIWWIYNRLLYWFRFGFGKVIRVWWHSFNSSDSFPIGFSKKFQISVRSIDIIHLPMKISILEQNLKFSQIIGESYSRNYEERGYEIIYNPLEMLFPLILLMMWLHDFDCINHDYGPVSRHSSHHLLTNPLIL